MMRVVEWGRLDAAGRRAALARPARGRDGAVRARVAEILADVGARGSAAVAEWAVRLDGWAPRWVEVDARAVAEAEAAVDPADLAALYFAADAVRRYHQATRPGDVAFETVPGARVRRVWRAIAPVGLYVPGGTAPLFSSLLHLAIPARVAGCREVVVATPPARDGRLDPMMVLAAARAGVGRVWLCGGAQAVAAMAIGIGGDGAPGDEPGEDGVPRCAKLFGPGNAWVAEAKRQAAEMAGGPAVDMPAGPSELMVVADASANPARVAADLLSQAEHDADAQVVLVALGGGVAGRVAGEVARQVVTLPRRRTAEAALAGSRAIVVGTRAAALAVVNGYAAEHLSVQVADAGAFAERVSAAGTVFVGPWSAETFGDYLSGPSHVLPTDGAARAWSGVSVGSFLNSVAVQEATAEGAAALAGMAARLARAEGLEAHARAADLRARPQPDPLRGSVPLAPSGDGSVLAA